MSFKVALNGCSGNHTPLIVLSLMSETNTYRSVKRIKPESSSKLPKYFLRTSSSICCRLYLHQISYDLNYWNILDIRHLDSFTDAYFSVLVVPRWE